MNRLKTKKGAADRLTQPLRRRKRKSRVECRLYYTTCQGVATYQTKKAKKALRRAAKRRRPPAESTPPRASRARIREDLRFCRSPRKRRPAPRHRTPPASKR